MNHSKYTKEYFYEEELRELFDKHINLLEDKIVLLRDYVFFAADILRTNAPKIYAERFSQWLADNGWQRLTNATNPSLHVWVRELSKDE